MSMPGVSIIVNNYNQRRYVGAAIESALAQDHPACEVIIVDDASTDGSQDLIKRYADRAKILLREQNGHQLAALKSAWPLASYSILIFLDADDLLKPEAASTVARAWTPETAKVQYCMESIDAGGKALGHLAPKYPPQLDTAAIRAELLRTGSAPSSPGSGNAYARWLLDRVAGDGGLAPTEGGVFWIDTMLEINAPFYGDVVTIREPLACYRMHDNNSTLKHIVDVNRFRRAEKFYSNKISYLAERCRVWNVPFDARSLRDRDLRYAEVKMALARLDEDGSVRRAMSVLIPALKACIVSPYSAAQKLVLSTWLTLVAAMPRPVAVRLIEMRYVVLRRPAWLERLLGRRKNPPANVTA